MAKRKTKKTEAPAPPTEKAPKGLDVRTLYKKLKEAKENGKGFPDVIHIIYSGTGSGEGIIHPGRGHESHPYRFSGGVPTKIMNPIDQLFFTENAKCNPELWKVAKVEW